MQVLYPMEQLALKLFGYQECSRISISYAGIGTQTESSLPWIVLKLGPVHPGQEALARKHLVSIVWVPRWLQDILAVYYILCSNWYSNFWYQNCSRIYSNWYLNWVQSTLDRQHWTGGTLCLLFGYQYSSRIFISYGAIGTQTWSSSPWTGGIGQEALGVYVWVPRWLQDILPLYYILCTKWYSNCLGTKIAPG